MFCVLFLKILGINTDEMCTANIWKYKRINDKEVQKYKNVTRQNDKIKIFFLNVKTLVDSFC